MNVSGVIFFLPLEPKKQRSKKKKKKRLISGYLAAIRMTSPATIILLITSGTHFGLILWKYTNINLRVINSSNSSIAGTGTLGVPFAVMQGGYMSLVAIVVISLITNYTGKLIIECLYEKPFNDQGTRGVRLRNSYALIGNTDFAVKNNL